MEKLTARSYIEKRIQTARTPESDREADLCAKSWGHMPANPAIRSAEGGLVEPAASFLYLNPDLTIDMKARILAQAYATNAENIAKWTSYSKEEPFFRQILDDYPGDAQNLNRIAQGLTRAANKLQKP